MPSRAFAVDVIRAPHHRFVKIVVPTRSSAQYGEAEEAVREAISEALWQGHEQVIVDGVGAKGRVRVSAHRGWGSPQRMLDAIDRHGGAFAWLEEQAAMTYIGAPLGALREVHVQVNEGVAAESQ
jgi:hemin uptake protein HemP